MSLRLPEVTSTGEDPLTNCLICGARPESPDSLQHVLPDGKISMSVDCDLCMECAIHVWRAFKELYGSGTVRFAAIKALKRYSLTAEAMRRQCGGSR